MTVLSPTIWCDPCVAPIVSALNQAGIPTIASCCGHGRRPAIISLADGQDLLIMPFDEASRISGLWPGINDEPVTMTVEELT